MKLITARNVIIVSIYELIFSPLLFVVTPNTLLRVILAVGFVLGVVGLWAGVSWRHWEREASRNDAC